MTVLAKHVAAIAAVTLFTAAGAGQALAACAAAEGTATGYNTAQASQLAQFDALQKMPAEARFQAQYSQPACYYLDNQNAAVDLVRCTITASWCTTPALPQQPTPTGMPGGPTLGTPPIPPGGGGGRYCGQLSSKATAGSLSKARTTVYRSIRRALRQRGTQAGAPGVVVHEPACLYQDNFSSSRSLVTCTMTAEYCR